MFQSRTCLDSRCIFVRTPMFPVAVLTILFFLIGHARSAVEESQEFPVSHWHLIGRATYYFSFGALKSATSAHNLGAGHQETRLRKNTGRNKNPNSPRWFAAVGLFATHYISDKLQLCFFFWALGAFFRRLVELIIHEWATPPHCAGQISPLASKKACANFSLYFQTLSPKRSISNNFHGVGRFRETNWMCWTRVLQRL